MHESWKCLLSTAALAVTLEPRLAPPAQVTSEEGVEHFYLCIVDHPTEEEDEPAAVYSADSFLRDEKGSWRHGR